jgi:predicted AAA+ superfamily ATPase
MTTVATRPETRDFVPRAIDLTALVAKKTHFLFGPRQTGKTSLIRHTVRTKRLYNLLESDTYLSLSREPWRLRQEIPDATSVVVIDEIQKIPSLLDEVQWLIEERGVRFLLTGSSARKLRHGGVNLLGGRARSRTLHPLVACELGEVDLLKALSFGTLPSVYFSDSPREDLRSYTGDYLREEIAHEGLARSVPAFSRFLEVAALCNGKMLNFSQIASDAQVPRTTVHEYFAILKDTLIGYELPAWGVAKNRKPLTTSKLYFFDGGVARALQGRGQLDEKAADFGEAFEAWLFHELKAWADYRADGDVKYWRTTSGFEVDFILGEAVGVEVKAKRRVDPTDLKGLRALRDETGLKRLVVVSLEARARVIDGIEVLPWRDFLRRLWRDEYR